MNHKAQVQLETHTVEDTQQFGQTLGKWVQQNGEPLCMALIGDLGMGKTHLSQGIAKGFGVTEEITSPTFAIMNTYDVNRTHLYHFDVYRIGDPEEMYEIGYEEYFFGEGVCLIEWSKLIEELIPEEAINIEIDKNLEKGLDYRKITVEGL